MATESVGQTSEVRQLAPFSAIFGFENAFKSMGKPGRVKTIVLAN